MSAFSEEGLGEKFNLEIYLNSQEKTRQLVKRFSEFMVTGLSEQDAKVLLEKTMDHSGLEKRWHPTKLRMGQNTTCNFRDESTPAILNESDIFFVDIGPVYSEHEADYGETFVIGNDPQLLHLRDSTRIVFNKTKEAWKTKSLTGPELYQYASDEAKSLGLRLNSNMYGHRMGDFPHAVHSRAKLGDLTHPPSANLWILEVHLIDDSIKRGAFFEDLL